MYKLTVFQLRKPVGAEDNEADEVVEDTSPTEEGVIELVRLSLPSLGGEYGKWLEISKEDDPINFPDKDYEAKYAHACGYHD